MDESNGFTQYGLIPSGPLNLATKLGKLSLSALGDISKKILQGEAVYNSEYGNIGMTKALGDPTSFRGSVFAPGNGQISGYGTMDGINDINYSNESLNVGTDTKGNYYGSYQEGPFMVGGDNNNNYYGTFQEGPYSASIDNKGNYSGRYQGDGFQVNATDRSLDTAFEIPMMDKSNSMSGKARYDSNTNSLNAELEFQRRLDSGGVLDIVGKLSPEDQRIMLNYMKKF